MGHRYWVYIYPKDDEKHGRLLFVTKIKPLKERYSLLGFKYDYGRVF